MTFARRVFAYDGLRVLVEAGDSRHLEWLEEFLTPAFDVVADVAADVRVTVVEDTARFESLRDAGPSPDGREIEVFALDRQAIRLPHWRQAGPGTTVFDDRFGAFYEATPDRRHITILARAGEIAPRTSMMRIVRETVMNHTYRRGNLFLHAAGCAVDGRGVVVAGPSKAGKTTLLLQLLRQPGARYLANDRIRVRMAPAAPELRGMPTIVTLRQGTVGMFPELAARLATRPYHHRLRIAEVAVLPPEPAPSWRDGRIGVSPAQFCDAAGVSAIAEAPATALLFPRITGEPGDTIVRPLPPSVAAAQLAGALFGVRSWKKTSDLFSLPDDDAAPSRDALMALCSQFAEVVPCFECRLGNEAYAAPMTGAVLEEVLG